MKSRNQSFFISALLLFSIVAMVFYGFQEQAFGTQAIPINQLAADVEADLVGKIEIKGDDINVTYRDITNRGAATTVKDPNTSLIV